MRENWEKYIESFSEKELFNYLTIDRGIYQKDAINYVEKILRDKKLTLIELQKKYNYDQKSIESEIIKRINSEESIQKIEQNFIERELEQHIHLIEEQNTLIKNREKKKKRKSKIIFNTVLSLIYSLIFLSNNKLGSVNIYQFLVALMVPIFSPFIFYLVVELLKIKFSKEHKFEIFSDSFVKTWYYFILFLYFKIILFAIN